MDISNRTEKQVIGQKGEDMAVRFLTDRDFVILDRNYRKPWGELDIVAKKGERFYFVEVKTVTREQFREGDYEPEDNIHPWKIKRLSRAVETYLLEKKLDDEVDWQIDSIAVYLDKSGGVLKIDYLEDIF